MTESTISGPRPGTIAVRSGLGGANDQGAVVPPIHLTSTFTFESFDKPRDHDYSRTSNPTRDILGDALASLEGGAGSTITGSGMSAISLVCHLVKPGDVIVAPHDCYGGTHRLLTALAERGHFEVRFANLTEPKAVADVIDDTTRLVLVETPSNPLLRITDIRGVAHRCRESDALLAVDNTFLSPALQTPIALGADLVIHSTTKYLNGHSDVVGGAVVAADPDLHLELQWWANCLGLSGSAFDSYLTTRGLRTLHARMRSHLENARAVVEALQAHPAVDRVYYPGLEDHPGHAVAAHQQGGYGAMVSFELGGDADLVPEFLHGLELFFLAESLGGVESLVAHPATMTHASMSPETRRSAGISDRLIRLSVGIEDSVDLVADLTAALDRVAARVPWPAGSLARV